jgi:primosomal protein N' (replication factor Y)
MLATRAQALLQKHEMYKEHQVLGPAEAAMAKLRGKFRYHLLVKANSAKSLQAYCSQLIGDESWIPSGVRIAVDIDPLNLI